MAEILSPRIENTQRNEVADHNLHDLRIVIDTYVRFFEALQLGSRLIQNHNFNQGQIEFLEIFGEKLSTAITDLQKYPDLILFVSEQMLAEAVESMAGSLKVCYETAGADGQRRQLVFLVPKHESSNLYITSRVVDKLLLEGIDLKNISLIASEDFFKQLSRIECDEIDPILAYCDDFVISGHQLDSYIKYLFNHCEDFHSNVSKFFNPSNGMLFLFVASALNDHGVSLFSEQEGSERQKTHSIRIKSYFDMIGVLPSTQEAIISGAHSPSDIAVRRFFERMHQLSLEACIEYPKKFGQEFFYDLWKQLQLPENLLVVEEHQTDREVLKSLRQPAIVLLQKPYGVNQSGFNDPRVAEQYQALIPLCVGKLREQVENLLEMHNSKVVV